MPKLDKKHYPYTKAGYEAHAKALAMKKKKKKKKKKVVRKKKK